MCSPRFPALHLQASCLRRSVFLPFLFRGSPYVSSHLDIRLHGIQPQQHTYRKTTTRSCRMADSASKREAQTGNEPASPPCRMAASDTRVTTHLSVFLPLSAPFVVRLVSRRVPPIRTSPSVRLRHLFIPLFCLSGQKFMVPPFSVALHALCIWCLVLVWDIRGVPQQGVG